MIPALLRLLAAAVVITLIIRWLRRQQLPRDQQPEARDANDVAKNPDLLHSLQEFYQQEDRELELAKHWSDDEVALAIEQYVFKLQHSADDHDDLLRKLAQQPETTQRLVMAIANDPDMQTRLRKEPRGEPAIYRAVQLLMQNPTRQAKPFIERLLAASNQTVRQDAQQWLAQLEATDD
jgi:hypothetical protein